MDHVLIHVTGGVAQMVERSLSMREVPGSIPGTSIFIFYIVIQARNKRLFYFAIDSINNCHNIDIVLINRQRDWSALILLGIQKDEHFM